MAKDEIQSDESKVEQSTSGDREVVDESELNAENLDAVAGGMQDLLITKKIDKSSPL